MIAERGTERARFEQGDAFDHAQLAALTPKPTLGIVSGPYELFAENELVRRSLAGLAEAIPPGGIPHLHRAAMAPAAKKLSPGRSPAIKMVKRG